MIKKFFDFVNEKYSTNVEEYVGYHSAPTKDEENAPLYDLSLIYPDDVYSSKGSIYYGDGIDSDRESWCVICSVRNKPSAKVKIYRAVPDFNKEIKDKIKDLSYIINYHHQFKFFPVKNKIVHELENKYDIEEYGYDKRSELILKDIDKQIDKLSNSLTKKPTINKGDWVTLSRSYAKEHGKSNLNNKYVIISKTVRADQLFTDGNSLNEFGYDF